MSQSSTQSTGRGPDFHLADEILSIIPTDPHDQLDLAKKITSMAIASRVCKLESDTGNLRQKLYDKDRVIADLEDKVLQLEEAYQDAQSRLKLTLEDNMKLAKEQDSLVMATKKLGRDLSKLETFKRQLMISLDDDSSSPGETVDIGTYDQAVPKSYPIKEETNGDRRHHSFGSSVESGSITDDASKQAGQRSSITPYITLRLTPTRMPKIMSISESPRRYSTIESPLRISGVTSPSKSQYEGRGSMSSWYSSSQQSSAANSPPRGRATSGRTRIDGKVFFRQARSRLSYEQFSAFLANIKGLNAQKQSREETLKKAEEIFGIDNKDLYLSFQGLLNRNTQ